MTTDTSGKYVLSGVYDGYYTVTPSYKSITFTPASATVTVSGADMAGVNFTSLVPMLTAGKLLYPCPGALCAWDLSTGKWSVVWTAFNVQPDMIVPLRAGKKIAYGGYNIDGIWTMSLATLVRESAISSGGFLAPNCASATMERVFDIGPVGDYAVIPSPCMYPGMPLRTDIFLVKTDGSLYWFRISDAPGLKHSPVIVGNSTNSDVTILYVDVGTNGIVQQTVDPVNGVLIGLSTVFATNVMDGNRSISVSSDYANVAFMKNVGGQSHIVVKTAVGGAENDLGPGTDPYWALDGSNLVMYTADSKLWAMKADGTGKVQVPVPSNLWGAFSGVVFAPAGY